jgi:hypothetical protein
VQHAGGVERFFRVSLCAGLNRFRELKIVATAPSIVQEISRDSKKIGPGVRKLHYGSSASKQAKVRLLQDVFGDVLPSRHTHYVPPESFAVASYSALNACSST